MGVRVSVWQHCQSFQKTGFPALAYILCKSMKAPLSDFDKEQSTDIILSQLSRFFWGNTGQTDIQQV